ENEIALPVTFPSWSGMSPWGPVMVPVSFAPSTLKLNVVGVASPPRPGMSPVHFPAIVWAIAKPSNSPRKQAVLIVLFIVILFPVALDSKLRDSLYYWANGARRHFHHDLAQ